MDLVDVRQRHALLGVQLGQAEVAGEGVVGAGVRPHGHELEAHVDDVAARGVAVGGLDVDAHDHAGDRGVHPRNVEVARVGAGEGRDLRVRAMLQDRHGMDEVGAGQAARQARCRDVAELLDAKAVADVAVAVGERAHEVVREGLAARRGLRPGGAQDAEGLLVPGALRGERRVVGEKSREDEGARALYGLAEIHWSPLSLVTYGKGPPGMPDDPLG